MPSQSYRILLVAPDSAQAESLCTLILDEADSFQIVETRSVESAMPVLCTESVDALLLDEGALEEGVASLGKIHARFQSLPIVVVVRREKETLDKGLRDGGASEVLHKEMLTGALLKGALENAVKHCQTEGSRRQSGEHTQELFEKSKDRLSGGVAHDLSNLLCVISGHADLLAARLGADHLAARHVAQIKKAVDSASSLTRRLLAFNRKLARPQIAQIEAAVTTIQKPDIDQRPESLETSAVKPESSVRSDGIAPDKSGERR